MHLVWAVETQIFEFCREFIEKGRTPGDVIALEANDQLNLIFHWKVDRIPPETKNKLMNIFRTTESVHPRKIFCLLLEQIPVWTDDVSTNHSLTEESHQEGIVMENIHRLKRRASYSIEFPHRMEKSMAPDDQVTLPPSQYFSGVESMSYSPYVTLPYAAERYEVVEKMLYFQTKKLIFAPYESAPMLKQRQLDTIFDARALDMPSFGACLKENRHLATIVLPE